MGEKYSNAVPDYQVSTERQWLIPQNTTKDNSNVIVGDAALSLQQRGLRSSYDKIYRIYTTEKTTGFYVLFLSKLKLKFHSSMFPSWWNTVGWQLQSSKIRKTLVSATYFLTCTACASKDQICCCNLFLNDIQKNLRRTKSGIKHFECLESVYRKDTLR